MIHVPSSKTKKFSSGEKFIHGNSYKLPILKEDTWFPFRSKK